MPPLSRRQFLSSSAAVGASTALTTTASSNATASTGTATRSDLDSLVADAAERALQDHDAGGVAVAVVTDDAVHTSGHGHAFGSESIPVRPEQTLFRVGSVSKVVTWTALMQLVDRGRVRVDDSVDDHLDAVDIPETFDEPIRLEHLVTHTPGFEVRGRGDAVNDPEHVRPLPASVSTHVPSRVRPPGDLPQYTNYAAALAGQLTADVTGQSFASVVSDRLFDPLGMSRSTFDPAPAGLVPAAAVAVTDVVNFYSDVSPASGLHATADDMAQLLRLHLNGGVVDGERILSERAVERMHRQWYTPHERVDGMAFGLFENSRGDTRVVRHGGSVPQFACEFALVPADGVGLFVVAHGDEASAAKQDVVDALFERIVPVESTGERRVPSGMPSRADDLGGRYRSVNTADNDSAEKLVFGLFTGRPVDVRVADDGRLVTEQGGTTDEWVEVEPLVFEHVDRDETLLFREENGRVTHLLDGLGAYERIGPLDRLSVQGQVAAVAAMVALTGLVGWPVARGWRRYRGGSSPPESLRRTRWLTSLGAAGPLVLVVTLAAVGVLVGTLGRPTLFNRPPPWFGAVFVGPTLGLLATLGAAGYGLRAYRRDDWSRRSAVHVTAVLVSAAALYWLLAYWNLLWVRLG